MPAPRRAEQGRAIEITGAVPGAPLEPAEFEQRQTREPPRRRQPPAQRPSRKASSGKRSDLMSRILVAVPAVVLAIAFVDLGGIGWTLLMLLLGIACVSELYRMLDQWKPVPAIGFVVVAGMCLAAHFGGPRDMVGAAVAVVPLLFLAMLTREETSGATLSIAATIFGVMWIGFAFAHGVLLRDTLHGKGLLIDVMAGTFLADVAAYFGGRWFGRRPLAPTISPNKTVEGLFCGGIAAVIAVFCAGLYQSWLPHGTALIIGLTIAVMGPLGDLFESLVKRDAGTKDAGTMFGAHGGALDRLDAVSFTVVAVYYVWVCIPH